MGLKFMQRAEQNKKEMAKEQAHNLIEQIKEIESETDEEKQFVKAADRFGGQALKVPSLDVKKHTNEEDLKKAA